MRRRIIIFSTFATPFRSGAEACAEEVPLALSDRYDFTIVTAWLDRSLPKLDQYQGSIPVVRVGFGHAFDKWLFPFLAPLVARSLKPDIIHAVLESYAGLAMIFARWLTSAKTILTCQSTNTAFLIPWMHRSAHHITVISWVLSVSYTHLTLPTT